MLLPVEVDANAEFIGKITEIILQAVKNTKTAKSRFIGFSGKKTFTKFA
jgi:hypothetical protein